MRLATPPRHSLSDIPASHLLAEIRRRERVVAELRRKHAACMAKLARLEAKIFDLGEPLASPRRRGRRAGDGLGFRLQPGQRARNEVPLHTAMHAALKGKEMNAGVIADVLLRSGYRTTSKNFRQLIALTFIKHPDLFKRVARGTYTAK